MTNKKVFAFNPTAKKRQNGLDLGKRSIDLEGKVLGVIWNGKLGGDILLDRFAELLKERFHLAQVLRLNHRADSFLDLPEDRMMEFAEKCSFVIVGVGD